MAKNNELMDIAHARIDEEKVERMASKRALKIKNCFFSQLEARRDRARALSAKEQAIRQLQLRASITLLKQAAEPPLRNKDRTLEAILSLYLKQKHRQSSLLKKYFALLKRPKPRPPAQDRPQYQQRAIARPLSPALPRPLSPARQLVPARALSPYRLQERRYISPYRGYSPGWRRNGYLRESARGWSPGRFCF
jgi:hypothetical protein